MADLKTSAAKPRKRFVGSKTLGPGALSTASNQIPGEVLHDEHLNRAIGQLPANYSFEIHKTIHHIRKNDATTVALQMPEGLQMFACTVSDIIEQFTSAVTVILGDVTYGACCVDDYTALALGCDMLVHYGHSCLVPIDQTLIKTLYVFVEISIDSSHLEKTIRLNLPSSRQDFHQLLIDSEMMPSNAAMERPISHLHVQGPPDVGPIQKTTDLVIDMPEPTGSEPTRLALVSTIQFVAALQHLKETLVKKGHPQEGQHTDISHEKSAILAYSQEEPFHVGRYWTGSYDVTIPRSNPLSPGEILGCTAPHLGDVDAVLYLGDGRFHLESIMIANPSIPVFKYDPYSKKLTKEWYNHSEMQHMRKEAVERARTDLSRKNPSSGHGEVSFSTWGIILGTLGRQGSLKQLEAITRHLRSTQSQIPCIQILLSEIAPAKLSLFNPHISIFVQTSCPRLSIDWGYAFDRPLLSPYEMAVATQAVGGWIAEGEERGVYVMDFYERGSPWTKARSTGRLGD